MPDMITMTQNNRTHMSLLIICLANTAVPYFTSLTAALST